MKNNEILINHAFVPNIFRLIALGWLLLLIVALSGCASDADDIVQATEPISVTSTVVVEPTEMVPSVTPTSTVQPTATATPSPEPTATQLPATATVTPSPESTATQLPANIEQIGENRYHNLLYGVTIALPDSWVVSHRTTEHGFVLRKDEYTLILIPSDVEGNFVHSLGGIGAGSFIVDESADTLIVLGEVVVHRYLTYEGERRRLFYTSADNELFFDVGSRRFHASFAKRNEADLNTEADRIAIAEADQIIQSISLDE